MGKRKKGFNWKARQQVETQIDHTEEAKIKLDHKIHNDEGYDDSNALVLPAKKRKTKIKHQDEAQQRLLSRKQRKRLEKIVEQKEKKAKRASLLESLKDVQATEEEISLFTSTTEMHSQKFKKSVDANRAIDNIKTNAISGSNKKKGKVIEDKSESESEESSEEETESEVSEEEEEKEEETITKDGERKNDSIITEKNDKPLQDQSKDTKPISAEKKDNALERIPAVHVALDRDPEIQESRLKLPILAEEQVIMEAINENPVVILCGETGSGKTTQVPQFLYEAGYAHKTKGIIGVTEPRRVAAISMSKRVGQEMGLTTREVSYQIRYEGNTTEDTKIKFMTDGVLLKEVQKDFMLTKYSVVIIDEAHERSVYTDILIGLLSRIGPLREKKGNPLKLIIMSATLRVEDFTQNTRLFKVTPPVIKVDSRQYPVTIHFNKKTPTEDYLGETYKKICKIHKQLPSGGILVFVTGQQEVHTLCAKLRRAFPFSQNVQDKQQDTGTTRRKRQYSEGDTMKPELPKVNLDDYSVLPLDEEAELQSEVVDIDEEMSDRELEEDDMDMDEERSETKLTSSSEPLHVLPLYSLLPSHRQSKVFEPPPEGSRLCVVATNVAETSLTIPNVKYVVDTGKVKTKFYDKVTGVSTFQVTWTSKAAANQRAGRAGRMGAGHCYRLYSSAVFNDDFEKFAPPEIARRPVDDLVLQMKDMGIDKVVNFPFPTPPDFDALKTAEKLLVSLGALEQPPKPKSYKESKKNEISTRITPLGKAMACFPVSPRYGKMLSVGHQHDLLPYVIAIVSALSVQEVLESTVNPANSEVEKEEQNIRKTKISQIRKTWAGVGESLLLGDLTVMLKAVGACEYAGCTPHFCEKHGIRYKAMTEVRKLRVQLSNAVNAVIADASVVVDPKMDPPDELQTKLLRQVVLSGMGDHVARKMPAPLPGAEDAKKLKYAYQSMQLEEPVYIHPGSVLFKEKVEYVIYQHIDETSKMYMKGVSVIEPEWLPSLVSSHCQFSKPLEEPPPSYNEDTGNVVCHMSSTFGPCNWQIPPVELEYPDGLEKYKLFAKFLLEGKVFKNLKKYTPHLLSTPSTMIKSWAKLQPRTEKLLQALIDKQVDAESRLSKVWQKDPQYLLSAYAAWIPQSLHEELKQQWPPL